MEAHPVAWFATRVHQVLDEVMAGSTNGLSGESAGDAAILVARAEARLSALRLRLLDQAHREDVSAASESVTEGWWAHAATIDHRRARRDLRMSQWLAGDYRCTEAALAAGEVSAAQAEVIVDALRSLPPSIGPEGRAKAEQHLLEQAEEFGPKQLRHLGRHLIDVIDPDAADERLAAQLATEERAADQRCFLQMYDDGKGTTHLKGALPTLAGDQLRTMLNAFASPRRPEAYDRDDPDGARLPNAVLLGRAFVEMMQRYPADRVPESGGLNATVMVTMSLETLLGGLSSAELLADHQLSPAEARRLACEAGILPVVLGGDSQPLDHGREKRFHTPGQRKVIFARDRTCRAEGCEIPANWCHVHHLTPWSKGGSTSVDDAMALCSRHHTAAHDTGYEATRTVDGRLRFTRIRT